MRRLIFCFALLCLVHPLSAKEKRPSHASDVKFTGDFKTLDILKLYEKAAYKIGDFLPLEIDTKFPTAHCQAPFFEPIDSFFFGVGKMAYTSVGCFVWDPTFPVSTYNYGIQSHTRFKVTEVALSFKEGVAFKDEKVWAEKIPYKFLKPLHRDIDPEYPESKLLWYGTVQLNDTLHASLGFRSQPKKNRLQLETVSIITCDAKVIEKDLTAVRKEFCDQMKGAL